MYTPQNLTYLSQILSQYPDTDRNKDPDVSIFVLNYKVKQNFLSSHALVIVWHHFVDEHFASTTEQYHH